MTQSPSLNCWCTTCRPPDPADPSSMRLALCPTCGNKRCPRAHNHTLACANNNAPGQPGSSWEHVRPVRETVVCAPRRPGKQTAADREMLEMAAKAAGILGAFSYFSDAIGWRFFRSDTGASWSPHSNDRDCARLEAALGISVNWLNLGVRCSKEFDVSPDIVARVPYLEHGGDKQATRRHCVLLVAAAIGRAMP